MQALADDLNTPKAIAELHVLTRLAQSDEPARIALGGTLQFLGFLRFPKSVWLEEKYAHISVNKSAIEDLIAARNAARKAKNFEESDRIRDELAAMGVVLKDSKDGTTWKIAR